ncbi:MAG: ABC transporter permease [Bacteroidales bacterium]
MIFSVSWRNVWRNKVRSLVVIFAVAIGIFAGVWATAFMTGMMNQRIQKVINTELSNIQIHNPDFRKTSELSNSIPDANTIVEKVKSVSHVTGASNRIVIQSMVSSAETAAGVLISGIDPTEEITVTNIHEKIIEGDYFDGINRNPVLIGKKLAEKLNVKLRSKIVITVQDLDNNITSGAFRVVGIFSTNNNMYDESHVYVRYSDLAALTRLPENQDTR